MTTTPPPSFARPPDSPWHAGEFALQARGGMAEKLDLVGRKIVRDYMPEQHQLFFGQLPFVVVGSVDGAEAPWAGLITGEPGFANAPDPETLSILATPAPDDPVTNGLGEGAPIGVLGIELHTRRRNRLNGIVHRLAGGLEVAVRQSFGNCPQYINLRDVVLVRDPSTPAAGGIETMDRMDADARRTIGEADTFFVASYADTARGRQVDVSHRGGEAGFVSIENDTLLVPDFRGNYHFATLGNVLLTGKAGLVFVDFERGDLLQMSGTAAVGDDVGAGPNAESALGSWRFHPEQIIRRRNALPLRWRRPVPEPRSAREARE